ncbi:MAG: 30S ribosomal protein S12 methylthiotransferase RimO [Thermodesulfobacteriota bacterium]
MQERVCLVSLGCPKNLVDSEIILGLLSKAGYFITTEPEKAEILIVNTCAFIQEATEEAIETILRLLPYRREGNCKLFIVSGCLTQRYGNALERELPEVDLFVGTGSFHKIPKILTQKRRKRSYLSDPTYLYNDRTPRLLSTPLPTAYLKIADGCSKSCTFCTVPLIRGSYRSRRLPSILREAERLAFQGVQELILIAQDTTAYGEDLGSNTSLEKLLKALVQIEGLRWIRILYAYPRNSYFSDSLLELIAREEKICSYLDLPIQHIDDAILKRMGRRTQSQEIRGLLKRIRSFIPQVSLRTTLMVGFPGEKEPQFNNLLEFVKEAQFDHLGCFKYSPEEGTPASRLSQQVPERVKEERLRRLMKVQKEISHKKYQKRIGERLKVLVEGEGLHKGTLRGRLESQAPEIDGGVFLKGKAKPGDWVEVQIVEALPYDLIGEIKKILP